MDANEIVKFLNTMKPFVPLYWRRRIEEIITKMGGRVNPHE